MTLSTQVEQAYRQGDPIKVLTTALIGDGFTVTVYHPGPPDQPAAVTARYDWDRHVDVLTVQRGGAAAVARLDKPVDDVLEPPRKAVWAWTGDPQHVIRALLALVEPDDPNAPRVAELETPEALTVPRGWRQSMRCHTAAPEKAEARGDRLRLARLRTSISQEFFEDLFNEVDYVKTLAFVERFAPDGTFQFGNFPPATGHDKIMEMVATVHDMFASVRHEIEYYEELANRAAFLIGRGTFVRHGGSSITVPFSTLTRFNSDYQIVWHGGFVDLSGVLPCFQCGFQAP